MGYFNNLKFGGGSIGAFDNTKLPKGTLLDMITGSFRTQGSFGPGSTTNLFKVGDDPNTNTPNDWNPSILIKPLMVKTKDGGSKRYEPGFLPPSYLSQQIIDKTLGKGKINEYSWNEDNAWIGHLLNSHIESDWYSQFTNAFTPLDTNQRINETTTDKVESEPYSARDFYLRFNDQRTDYFRHGLHIDGYTDLKNGKNSRESWDGSGDSFRLGTYPGTSFENSDPVIYGFEIVFDTFSSPLLNGSVEDFIDQFSYVSEIASKAIVIDDFKRQFIKLFRTKGNLNLSNKTYSSDNVLINNQRDGQVMASNTEGRLFNNANSDSQTNLYRPGKKAYLGYYLQKIDGLANLSESNTSDKKKYLTDYGKDVIKLSFLEDVSATMGTLAHLYKLLYWSKPNGKNLIPENLLRFNCDIIISECRNFNRVRKSTNTGDLEIVKDNVSRYIYQLRECQFYFDKMPHEDSVDMGSIKHQETYEVTFDYKYSATKFEKWIPAVSKPSTDKQSEKFGQYVGYNNGAIWKIGNKDMRGSAFKDGQFIIDDKSTPKFYTISTNTLRENGVTKAVIMDAYKINSVETDGEEASLPTGASSDETPSTTPKGKTSNSEVEGDEEAKGSKKEDRKKKAKAGLDKFKDNSKKVATNIAKGAAKYVFNEVNNQINIRARLLEATINKTKNLLGLGGIKSDPKMVYPRPYSPHSLGIFFDVRNDLFNFVGDEIAGIISGSMQSVLPGTQLKVPFTQPNVGATLDKLTKSFSAYTEEAKIIGALQSKGPKKAFFDTDKFSTKWTGMSINKIYNSTTTFKYPLTTENTKYGGGFGVLALSYMKPKGTIYDGIGKPATMINVYSNPLNKGHQIGTSDFSKIQFPDYGQKYPAPLIQGNGTLGSIWNSKTTLGTKYGTKNVSSIQFPKPYQKYPAPLIQGNSTLTQIVQAGTMWSFPVNNKKFGL
jgi:hypothetical protein